VDGSRQGVSIEEQPGAEFEISPAPTDTPAGNRIIPIARFLWSRRSWLMRVVMWGLIVSVVLAFVVPKRYESTTRLMPPDEHNAGLGLLSAVAAGSTGGAIAGGGFSGIATDLLGLKTSGALFVAILNSRTVQDRLIDRFDLRKLYGVKRYEDARKTLTQRTSITEDRKSGVIAIDVWDHDARRAAEMAKAYVQELDRLVSELSTSDARRERQFLEIRLTEVKQELDVAERGLSEFSSKNATLDLKEQGRATVEGAARLQGELIAAQAYLSGIEQIYTSANVRVRSARARVSQLQHDLDRLGGTGQVRAGDKELAYPSIRQLPILGVAYADLYRRVRIEEIVFEALTKQYELAKVQEAKQIPTISVLDVANVPERPVYPSKLLFLIFGFSLSLVLGCAWIIGVELWNQIEAGNPGKEFAREIYAGVRERSPWARRHTFRVYARGSKFVNWIRRSGSAAVPEVDAAPDSAPKANATDK
jgi:uncharacterized protein involved in exopolysaccharide biosynthesis